MLVIGLIMLHILLCGWALYDYNTLRRKKIMSAIWPWAILFFPLVGSLAYFFVRPSFRAKPDFSSRLRSRA